MSRKTTPRETEKTKKLTRAQKKEIDAVIRKYKGDGKPRTAQATIPYEAIYPDGVCRIDRRTFSKCIAFEDISYQLAQPETRTAIFEHLCDLYNYVDASIHVQFSFLNRKVDPVQYAKSFEIAPQGDDFDDIRAEYTAILQKQLASGNNGIVKTKYLTFTIEADSLKTARARLTRISVTTDILEHFTSPPKAYTEDTLLSAMERAGAEDMPEEAERKGLGTPATRAAILEKLVQMGFVQRKGKQLVPTKDGINLAVVLPESLTSPALTAEWENRLTEIAKGNADPDEFMAEIEAQVRQLIKTYSCISADKQNLFQSERVIIGKCPRCGENVYEDKKNFYCGNRGCQFVMWKNDRFFEQRKKAFIPKIAAALLKNGKAKVKGLYSEKTGKTYDATVLLADTGGKYVNYRVERKG